MDVLKVVLPVFVMLAVGVFCRKLRLLSRAGVDDIKNVVVKIMLPVTIFHALATASYSMDTATLAIIMLVMLIVTFAAGHVMRPLVKPQYRRYVPYMVSIYEGGMMAYPLFASLCGSENLWVIATVDLAGAIFGPSIVLGMLKTVEDGQSDNIGQMVKNVVSVPAFIGSVLGVVFGLTGWMDALLASPFGDTYLAIESAVTAPMTSMILIVVGFDLVFSRGMMGDTLKTILMRVVLQGVACALVLLAASRLIVLDKVLILGIIVYFSAPPAFSIQAFIRNEAGSHYASTGISIYCLVSVLVFTVLAVIGAV